MVVIQMRMHRRDDQLVMTMLELVRPAGELPLVMVVNVTQRGDAMPGGAMIDAIQLTAQQSRNASERFA